MNRIGAESDKIYHNGVPLLRCVDYVVVAVVVYYLNRLLYRIVPEMHAMSWANS